MTRCPTLRQGHRHVEMNFYRRGKAAGSWSAGNAAFDFQADSVDLPSRSECLSACE